MRVCVGGLLTCHFYVVIRALGDTQLLHSDGRKAALRDVVEGKVVLALLRHLG